MPSPAFQLSRIVASVLSSFTVQDEDTNIQRSIDKVKLCRKWAIRVHISVYVSSTALLRFSSARAAMSSHLVSL